MTDLDFYSPPPLGRGACPGDLLRKRPVFVPGLPLVAGAWQLLYASQNSRGELIAASGIVVVPDAALDTDPGTDGLLVYYPPFRGLGGRCATSELLATGDEPDTAAITAALEQGWAVAVPDGEGIGVGGCGPHTFLAARAGGQIVLDLARAAHHLPDLTAARMRVTAWGYGDGGRAVCAAAEMAPRYAPELDLRGVAAGAVASDLAALAPSTASGPCAALGLAGLIGLSRAHPYLPLRGVLTEEGLRAVAGAATLTRAQILERYSEQPLAHWCKQPDPWNTPVWRHVLGYETLVHSAPAVPVHLYHGHNDKIVPVRAGLKVLISYRQRSTELSWREYDAGHTGTALAAIGEVLSQLGEDLSRTPGPARARTARALRP
ncbi:hypothetical protein ABIA39_000287 [Nocardia sp. GAS34]|uniref:lipase family protein n=1 Tax=unclassified Nocardia TaxID=2637762 RepID=UPI003D259992